MNENEIKKDNGLGENQPAKPKETVYNDFEIFDLDSLRKSAPTQSQPKPQSKRPTTTPRPVTTQKPQANGALKTQPNRPTANPSKPNPVRTATPVNAPRQPQTNKAPSRPNVTNVKSDKVVFDSSSASRRLPNNILSIFKREKGMKPIKPQEEKTRGANPVTVLSKALIYIAVVLLVSCLCAYYIIVIANDVFAFVKAEAEIEVNIPEYATLDQIADELHDKQVIKYPKIFVLYTMIRGNDPGKYVSGIYTVSPTQNFDELLSTFVEKRTSSLTEVSVTIPEGYTIDDIINLLVNEKGIGTKEGFVDAIQNGEYDYWFIEDLENLNPNRKYRLEGYLYPDTYYFYKESEETVIINKMLANFHAKFSIEYKQECEKSGYTIDQVINLASLIQMEAKYTTDYTLVSSVFHNRLNSNYFGKRLESCASVQYVLDVRKDRLSNEDTQIDSPYNTYRNGGLPPGPISNPTLKAIRAALYPEQTNYYFFQNDIEGNMLYAKTAQEHAANRAKVDAQYAAAGN